MTQIKKALVTLGFGRDRGFYEDYFFPSMRAYCKKYNYDFIHVDEPFDKRVYNTPKEIISMQKFLICSQPWSAQYDYIVWMDADIIINVDQAPDIIVGVPEGKIGAVNERKLFTYEYAQKVWARWRPDLPQNGKEYYKKYGFPEISDDQFQAGVMVFQPKHHAEFLKELYDRYIDDVLYKDKIDGDQCIISYEAQKAGLVHWLDERFNMVWVLYRILWYPFLNNRNHTDLLREALKNFHDLAYVVHMAGHVDWDLLVTDT